MHTPGEEVKAKKENHLTRTRAREREETDKSGEEEEESPQVLFWSGGLSKYTMSNSHSTPKTSLYRVACNIENRFERVLSPNL